ncbi:alpha/beta hydrolase [Sulfurivermis fontis]|uniref:alpha/beta hydrolase n=1 Tax=Sulfurivermis fontis TaxID=1972068 RepID=UPI0015596D2B|nr:alpha/beta hydrolase [Sulfurivermis fontis]
MKRLLTALLLLASLGNAQAETLTLPHQGLQVSAELERAGDDWKAGPVILMLHGTLAHNRMEIISTLQQAFLERGYSSLAVNLSLGLSAREGMYDCAAPHRHLHTDAVDEVGLWLDWLKGQGVQSVVLFGHSRGGNQIARYAAAHDSALIRSVVLAAPQTWSAGYDEKNYQTRYGKPLATELKRAEALVAKGQGDTLMQPVDILYCQQTAATAHAFLSYHQPDPRMDTPTVLREVRKPTLVIAGSADETVRDLPERMSAANPGAHAQLVTIDGADHFFLDLYAEELADAAAGFIEAH